MHLLGFRNFAREVVSSPASFMHNWLHVIAQTNPYSLGFLYDNKPVSIYLVRFGIQQYLIDLTC